MNKCNCGNFDMTNFGRYIVMMFTNDLMTAAELNWLPSHIQQLKRLMTGVMLEKDYAEVTQEDIDRFLEGLEEFRQKLKEGRA